MCISTYMYIIFNTCGVHVCKSMCCSNTVVRHIWCQDVLFLDLIACSCLLCYLPTLAMTFRETLGTLCPPIDKASLFICFWALIGKLWKNVECWPEIIGLARRGTLLLLSLNGENVELYTKNKARIHFLHFEVSKSEIYGKVWNVIQN